MTSSRLGLSLKPESLRAAPSPLSSPTSPNSPIPRTPLDHDTFPFRAGHANPPLLTSRDPSPKERTRRHFFSNPLASRSSNKLAKSSSPSRVPTSSSQRSNYEPSAMSHVFSEPNAMESSPELLRSDGASLSQDESAPTASINESLSSTTNTMELPKKKASKHMFNLLPLFKDKDSASQNHTNSKSLAVNSSKSRHKAVKSSASSSRTRSPEGLSVTTQESNPGSNQSITSTTDSYVLVDPYHHHQQQSARQQLQPHAQAQDQDHPLHNNAPQQGHHSQSSRSVPSHIGRAAKGLLGKLSNRAGLGDGSNSHDRFSKSRTAHFEAAAQRAALSKDYRIINRPLEQQTRVTRICKKLESCKDKTEFWLPAIAYRCVDYLNDKGMTHEGLYRVPGSEREIRNWIYRFDQEHDIDLLAEDGLRDVNTISSMFKAWLRDLPDEIFPKALQHQIIASVGPNTRNTPAPAILKDYLSTLPPFNYYLLFAVTAHLNMLLSASSENKMDFSNLCICFMPALKMELPCFSWLIQDWKNCWQGCFTEKDYMDREYAISEGRESDQSSVPRPLQHYDRYNSSFHSLEQPQPGLESRRHSPSPQRRQLSDAQSDFGYQNPLTSEQTRPPTNRSNGSNQSSAHHSTGSHTRGTTSPARSNAFTRESFINNNNFNPNTSGSSSSSNTNTGHPDGSRNASRASDHNSSPSLSESMRRRPAPLATNSDGSFKQQRSEADRATYNPVVGNHRKVDAHDQPLDSAVSVGSSGDEVEIGTPRLHRCSDIPELSPVKPLSPFGNLS